MWGFCKFWEGNGESGNVLFLDLGEGYISTCSPCCGFLYLWVAVQNTMVKKEISNQQPSRKKTLNSDLYKVVLSKPENSRQIVQMFWGKSTPQVFLQTESTEATNRHSRVGNNLENQALVGLSYENY